mgnify:CR=1 FL=1
MPGRDGVLHRDPLFLQFPRSHNRPYRYNKACVPAAYRHGLSSVLSADRSQVLLSPEKPGILAKKPDIRYKDMASLASLPAIQSAILDNASRYVRRGGTLVYSTCTVLPEENERVTDAFLRAHLDFTYDTFALPGPIGTVEGHITLWPQRHGTDGFYICRMTRKE